MNEKFNRDGNFLKESNRILGNEELIKSNKKIQLKVSVTD
jgi:hypothetical protein